MRGSIKEFIECESGTTAIEYAFVAGLISMTIVGTLTTFGTTIDSYFDSLSVTLANVAAGP